MSDDIKAASKLQADASDELSVVEDDSDELQVVEEDAPAAAEVEELSEALEVAADGGDDEEVEYEYVYEDENGNPIAAPEGGFDPEHFEEEVIEVIEEDSESGEQQQLTDPAAATVNIPPDKQETRRIRSGSTRRMSDRRGSRRSSRSSGRLSSRQMDPAQMKYAKLKTILMVGSILAIPVLIGLILLMCYIKGRWPFSPRKTKQVVVQNDYERGRDMAGKAWRAFDRARKTLGDKGKGYWYVDRRIQDANIKLREIREQKFKIEMRRGRSR